MIKNTAIKKKEWELVALEAIKLAFDNDGNVLKNLSPTEKAKAIELFYRAIDVLKADLCWPFIKLADLLEDDKEKCKLYARSLMVEDNIYAMKYLFKKINQDHPEILHEYL